MPWVEDRVQANQKAEADLKREVGAENSTNDSVNDNGGSRESDQKDGKMGISRPHMQDVSPAPSADGVVTSMAQYVADDEFCGAPRPLKKRVVAPARYFSVEKLWSEFRVYKRNTTMMAHPFTAAGMRDHFRE